MFCRLLTAHLLGDFVLQTRWMVKCKGTVPGLAAHLGAVGLTMALVAWDQLEAWWPWLLLILVSHATIDWAKIRLGPRLDLPPILPFLADQGLHLLILLVVVALAEPAGLGRPGSTPAWWIASVYLAGTFALSIALPLWLAPASLMRRPLAARLTLIVASAVVMTLAWQGLPLLIPLVALALYLGIAQRLSRKPATASFGLEFWSAVVLAASLGWGLI